MLGDMLASPNPMVRYGVGALVVFGPLYMLSSMGHKWAYQIAVMCLIGVVFAYFRANRSLAFG